MSWEWSHTQEAYAAVSQNIYALPDDKLAVIWAEWRAAEPRGDYGDVDLNLHRYRRELRRAYSWLRRDRRDELANEVDARTSELATCTNGGWKAWCCPFGCGCHMVPFDVTRGP